MGERVLPDGSIDYGQGIIGPSLSDRNLAKKTTNLSLGNSRASNGFHVPDLTPVAIIAPLALAGCGISIGGENKEIRTESLSQHFDSFLRENVGKSGAQLEMDIIMLWAKSLGASYQSVSQLDSGRPYEILTSPDIDTSNYFQIIFSGDGLPSKGDIVVARDSDNYEYGRVGIATGEVVEDKDEFYEEVLADVKTRDALIYQFPLNEIAGWLKPTQFIRPETPDEVAEASDSKSVSGLFDAFYYKYDGLYVEAEDDSPDRKFNPSDLVMAWVDTLGIPRETVKYESTDQILSERKDITDKYFEFIERRKGGGILPKKGDIIIVKPTPADEDPNGHMAIATGEGRIDTFTINEVNSKADAFTQGSWPGKPSHEDYYHLNDVYGWLTPINLPDSENSDTQVAEENVIDGESEEGQVLGAQSEKSIDELFDNFVEENEGVHGERAPMLRWLDTLGIPEETITEGYITAGDLLDNPTAITEQFFEVILKTGDNKPKKGDIVIVPPSENYRGDIGIATGETIENDWQGVFTTSAALDRFSYYQISGWLRAKGYDDSVGIDGESEEGMVDTNEQGGGEVLGVKTESIDQILSSFIEEWNGKYLDYDKAYGNQCVDTIKLYSKTLGGPEMAGDAIELFGKYPEFYESILNPKDGSLVPQAGDIVIWGEPYGKYTDDNGITRYSGHAAIATGKEKEGVYGGDLFEAFGQNYPLKAPNKLSNFILNDKSVIGWMRPKDFSERIDVQPPGEFVPRNNEELARYRIADLLISSNFRDSGGGWFEYWKQKFGLAQDQEEKIKQTLARGERVTDPISFYEAVYDSSNEYTPFEPLPPTLYVHDPKGDIYERSMKLLKGTLKNWRINLDSNDVIPEVRNAEYLAWQGDVDVEGTFEYGTVDLTIRTTLEDFQRWDEDIFSFPGFDKITKFANTSRSKESNLWAPFFTTIYVYENGDVECVYYNNDDFSYDSAFNYLYPCGIGTFNHLFSLFDHANIEGAYNGEFVIDLTR